MTTFPSSLTQTHFTANHESSFGISLNTTDPPVLLSCKEDVNYCEKSTKQTNKQEKKKTNERKKKQRKKQLKKTALFPARIELATSRVLGGRDNHYTTETAAKTLNQLLF